MSPELHNDDIAWFLLSCDGECGMQSSAGPMIDRIRTANEVGIVEDGNNQAFVPVHQDDWRLAPSLSLKDSRKLWPSIYVLGKYDELYDDGTLDRVAHPCERDAREFYKYQLGVGMVSPNPVSQAVSKTQNEEYSPRQCDYTDSTVFARARRCWTIWKALDKATQRTLAAYYFGMNPEWPEDIREGAKQAFKTFAAVACWSMNDEQLRSAFEDPIELRVKLELRVRAAHREWMSAGNVSEAA
jgi:hypothetical protein